MNAWKAFANGWQIGFVGMDDEKHRDCGKDSIPTREFAGR
jgi:hypothetical protein